MNPWFAKAAILVSSIVMVVIRAPHGERSRKIKVVKSRRGSLEIYSRVRHPMYLALLLYSAGRALALPNWVAGSAYGVAMALLFALRVGPEERMMREEFGKDYESYIARTKRLVPGVW